MKCDANWRKWTTYLDEARYAVNLEQHGGHIQKDIPEVMRDLCLWIPDGISS